MVRRTVLSLAVLLCVCTATAIAEETSERVERSVMAVVAINHSLKALEEGDLQAAIEFQKTALDLRRNGSARQTKLTIECSRNLAWLYIQAHDFQSAIKEYETILDGLEKAKSTASRDKLLIQVRRDFAWALHESCQFRSAASLYYKLLRQTHRDPIFETILVDALKLIDDMASEFMLHDMDVKGMRKILVGGRDWYIKNGQLDSALGLYKSESRLLSLAGRKAESMTLLQTAIKKHRSEMKTRQSVAELAMTLGQMKVLMGDYKYAERIVSTFQSSKFSHIGPCPSPECDCSSRNRLF